MTSHVCLLAPILGFLLLGLVSCEKEKDIRSLMHDTDVNYRGPSSAFNSDDDFEVEFIYPKKDSLLQDIDSPRSTVPVKRLWGVGDNETFVGRIFSYSIPKDAFQGDILTYQFPNLPSWLSFNSRKAVLEGVPSPSDEGTHYIRIKVEGKDKSTAKDAFAIEVYHAPPSALLEESECLAKDDLTLLSVLIDAPLSSIVSRDRVQLMRKIAGLFMTKSNQIYISSAPLNYDPLSDDSAIMAGPGSAKARSGNVRPNSEDTGTQGYTQVQWSIGCHGKVSKGQELQVTNVEASSANGKLQRLIGFPILGWHVTQVNPSTKRVRREVENDEYSGDYNTEDYDYDYDDPYNPTKSNRGEDPVVATPVYEEIPQSAYDGGEHVSPVLRPVPLSTPAYIPVKPTRVVVVDESTTMVLKTDDPFGKSEYDLESSLLVHPTRQIDHTTPLIDASTISSEPTRPAGPIEASAVPDRGETTEYGTKNFPPRISKRLQKMSWIAGRVHRMRIPKDTFYDTEDGNTRNLSLTLKNEGSHTFSRDSWIQFDPVKQEVYALPMEKDIGNYDFRLEAIDKERKSVADYFSVSVRQHRESRNFNHEFTAIMKLEKKYQYDFDYTLDWQVRAVEKIAALFLDSVSNIIVQNITANPVHITWTNLTLVDSSSTMCPVKELEAVSEVMLAGHNTDPSQSAIKVFKPEFQLKRINRRFYDNCQTHFGHHGVVDPQNPVLKENSEPIFSNSIDSLTATAGSLFRYKVPHETCYDFEEGSGRKLKMQLLTTDMKPPPPDSWLQFDSSNQMFFGLPLYDDAGRKEYMLQCMDSENEVVTDALVVEVKRRPSTLSSNSPVHFELTIDTDFDTLMLNGHKKANLIDRIAKAFGDSNASNVVVDSLRKGSVVIEWHNGSLPNDPCPNEEVQRLREIMTDNNGELKKNFKQDFLPDFKVMSGQVIPYGSCLAEDTPTHVEEANIGFPDEEEVSSTDEDYLLTFIVPAVIIAVMLLLAALIACCLYKRRRYGKMSMTDDNTFVSKGIPIIFAEELDDQRGTEHAKSPVIMKEEKPPLPPPPQASMDDAPYHPPPPFTSNGSQRNERPNLPPAYRKPPTYVPVAP